MLVIPNASAYLKNESRRLTVCGIIEKANGDIIRCTQHDRRLKIVGGDYAGVYESTASVTASDIKSANDMSVDNLETSGAVADANFNITGISAADIIAGQFRSAPFQLFLTRWDDPSSWQKPIRRGYLGNITRTAEGGYNAEWRGIMQILSQNVGRTYGENCDVVRFGDARCKFDVSTVTFTGTVSSAISRKEWILSLDGIACPPEQAAGFFETGELTFTSGANAGYTKQVKRDSIGGDLEHVQIWESLPYDAEPSDTVSIIAGCNRTWGRCQFWGNTINFRGPGRWIPGIPKIIRAP